MALPSYSPSRPEYNLPQGLLGGAEFDSFEPLARIGALGAFTRQGRMLYGTSFEAGLAGWTPIVFNSGSVTIDTAMAFHGAASLKLVPGTVGANIDCYAQKRFPAIFHGMYALEAIVNMDALATGFRMFLGMLSNGASVPQYGAQYDKATNSFLYFDVNGNWTQAPNTVNQPDLRNISGDTVPIWILMKLVVSMNPTSLGYHALIINDQVYDWRSLSFRNTVPAALNPRLTVYFVPLDTAGTQHPCHVDSMLLTTDEPSYVG